MRISENKAFFGLSDNPIAANLGGVVLPKDYKGSNGSLTLSRLFATQINAGKTAEQLSMVELTDLDENENKNEFIATAKRFGVDNLQGVSTLFYDLNPVLDFSNPETHYYLVEVAQTFPMNLRAISATLRQLYSTGLGQNEQGFIPADEIKKFFQLNSALRDEGVILSSNDLFSCSVKWNKSEVLDLIENGMTLTEAIRLYDVGFKTLDEIKNYSNAIPNSWIDKILG